MIAPVWGDSSFSAPFPGRARQVRWLRLDLLNNRLMACLPRPSLPRERGEISDSLAGNLGQIWVRAITMSYIESNLLPDETVLFRAMTHWAIYGMGCAVLGTLGVISFAGAGSDGFGVFLILAAQFAGPVFLYAFFRRRGTEMAATNMRLIAKQGVFQRVSIELPLESCEAILVDQSLLGRIFNFGSMTVRGTGGTSVTIHYIKDPLGFRKAISVERAKATLAAKGAHLA
jgi:uncharacterized membrane protein YdbT with pleckstrin-like domain